MNKSFSFYYATFKIVEPLYILFKVKYIFW
jgi:hypothetical protein